MLATILFQLFDRGSDWPFDWWLNPSLDETALQSEETEVGPDVEKHLGFVIRVPERRTIFDVIELPEGPVDVLREKVKSILSGKPFKTILEVRGISSSM